MTYALNTVMIIPTGVGACMGGFAGDGSDALQLLASVSDRLITHPNVANAGVFQHLPSNVWYVEGYALDQWMRGRCALQQRRRPHQLGVLLDAAIPERMRIHTLNTIRAVESIYPVRIIAIETTDEPVRCDITLTGGGGEASSSQGNVHNPDVLFQAGQRLLAQGATAIAVCVHFSDADTPAMAFAESQYKAGLGLDPIGGLEALISHVLVRQLQVPCAHAPVLTEEGSVPEFEVLLDRRVAPEYIAPTFVPCVLTGLMQSPDIIPIQTTPSVPDALSVEQVDAVVVPADALGCIPVLEALARCIPVIAVAENTTHMRVSAEDLGVLGERVHLVRNYTEAAGTLQRIKLGLNPSSEFILN